METNSSSGAAEPRVVDADVVQADLSLRGGLDAQRLRMAAMPELATPLIGMDVLGRLHFAPGDGVLRIETLGSP